MSFWNRLSLRAAIPSALGTAFIAIASRLVGSAFRVTEAYNPTLQQAKVISTPEIVLKREALTLGLAWGFAFLTNFLLEPLIRRRGWNKSLMTFGTTIFGAVMGEMVARLIAYRKALKSKPGSPRQPEGILSANLPPWAPIARFSATSPSSDMRTSALPAEFSSPEIAPVIPVASIPFAQTPPAAPLIPPRQLATPVSSASTLYAAGLSPLATPAVPRRPANPATFPSPLPI